MTRRPHRRTATALVAGALTLGLVACGGQADDADDSGSAPSSSDASPSTGSGSSGTTPSSPESSDTADSLVVDVTIEGGEVRPNGERLEATVGQPIVFRVTTDVPAEIHGHSSPEFTIEAEAGTSEHTVTIDTPSSVDVELHEPERLLVRIDVRP